MGFWDNIGGGTTAPAPPRPREEPVARPATSSAPLPWWAPGSQATQAPSQVQGIPQDETPSDTGEWNGYVGSTQPKKAMSRTVTGECPSCGSTNYFRPKDNPSAVAQCYECGYNTRFHQETVATPSAGAPVQATRQIDTGNNFNPQGVIGHINSV